MQKNGKLELTWVGKHEQITIEPRILIEEPKLSYGEINSGNMLIHGDNLIALRALEQDFSGKVKCIYIDPPYNTGSAFKQYEDGIEHSLWLQLMQQRLTILFSLLSDEGSIWINLDDNESHYCKVLCDEIFGRKNFVANVVWQKRIQPDMRATLGAGHDHILVYAKDIDMFRKNLKLLSPSDEQISRYKNPDNDPNGSWMSADFMAKGFRPNQMYEITTPSGKKYKPRTGSCWRNIESVYLQLVQDGKIWFGKDGSSVPRRKTYLSEVEGMASWSWWTNSEVGHNQEAKKESVLLFGEGSEFETPKPERLLSRIIHLASDKGDIILDSFLGSGTTAAVAHKMGRRWIGIELGEHAYTHCKVRLDKVIEGEQGGISSSIGWHGGGGYKFYELAPSLFEKHPVLPIYQINKAYTFEMLCRAICKLESFNYKPEGEMHGHSSEGRFIHITRKFVSGDYIMKIMREVGDKQSVLIYGFKIQSGLCLPDNVEIKKIPKDLLKKCDFQSEVR